MDAGELVPDELICGVIAERLDLRRGRRRLPRRLPAHDRPGRDARRRSESRGRSLTAVLLIDAPDDEVVRRLSGRRTCVKASTSTTSSSTRRRTRASATRTARASIQRDDDKPETVRKRLPSTTSRRAADREVRGARRAARFDGTRLPDEVHASVRHHAKARGRALVIHRKTPEEIEKMAAAGRSWPAATRSSAKARLGVTTAELDEAAERFIRSQGAEPAFKGYRGFPGSICASPNSMVVHGIPGSYRLNRGDILCGHRRDPRRLGGRRRDHAPDRQRHADRKAALASTRALFDAVEQCWATGWGRLARGPDPRRGDGFSVIRSLVGHGIGRDMHEDPQIPNFGDPGSGRSSRRAWCSRSSRW